MPDRSSPPPTVVSNNMAIALWIFMAVWLAMLCCFTYLFARDGSPPEVGVFGLPLLGLFWLAGIGVGAWAFSHPLIRVGVSPQGVVVRERWLWRARERRYAVAALAAPATVVGTDSDGDPYFKCVLTLPGGEALTVAESHARPPVEAVQRRLETALAAA
jgi:hypothetical protein